MKQLRTTARRMPAYTWNRLGVNTSEIVLNAPAPARAGAGGFAAPEPVRRSDSLEGAPLGELGTDYFVPGDMGDFIGAHANSRHYIQIPENYRSPEPIVARLRLTPRSPGLMDDVVVEAGARSEATVVVVYGSEPGSGAEHCGRTRVLVRPGARLRLVKAQMLAADAVSMDAVEGVVQDGARLDVILAELGALKSVSSCNVRLLGTESGADFDVVYLGDGERSLDMSYRIEHRGRKTVSGIRVKGILHGRSRKVLRDTLDFITGASGSRGREEENVLLLSPEARNISVPVLLCGEDDVEGEHAASSGRLDERVLFYLMSRGIGEPEARKLLAQAAISAIVEKIPDESLRDEILDAVGRSVTGKKDERT